MDTKHYTVKQLMELWANRPAHMTIENCLEPELLAGGWLHFCGGDLEITKARMSDYFGQVDSYGNSCNIFETTQAHVCLITHIVPYDTNCLYWTNTCKHSMPTPCPFHQKEESQEYVKTLSNSV